MTHVLDDGSDASFVVLTNRLGQHSMWPAALDVPAGWVPLYGPASRTDCHLRIRESWQGVLTSDDGRRDEAESPGYGGVPRLVSMWAARTPDAVAVDTAGTSLTYRALDERSDHYAGWLTSHGVVGEVVPILMARSADLIAMLLGVLKAGSAYLVIDPTDPPARQHELVRAARSRVLVVDDEARAPQWDDVVLLRTSLDGTGDGPVRVATTLRPDTAAYVCFTSGSTGEPRGVLVPHRAIVRLVESPSWISIGPDDVVLQCAPLNFDASTFEIWAALANGCRLVLHATERLELGELAEVLRRKSVSILWLTAGLFHRMVSDHLSALGGLRVLLAGGDVVSPVHVATLLAKHSGLTFINGYGPTENTTFTACWPTRSLAGAGPVPIGRAIDGTGVHVLDDDLRPLADGEVGELWADGEGLAIGYLGDTVATAERFVANPYASAPGARMYRTGDHVRRGHDGLLEFVGRQDGQVKIQGYRVDTAAVEHLLERHPAVAGAAVVPQVTEAGDARILAYVVCAPGWTSPSAASPAADTSLAASLRRWLGERVALYSVPWAVRVIPELPLTASGKVDRHALPVAKYEARNVWNDYAAPADGLESVLAGVWGEVLGIEPVGADDDFFDLGGHSLLAADLIGRLQREHGIKLPARVLYMQPTISAIANVLRSTTGAVGPADTKGTE